MRSIFLSSCFTWESLILFNNSQCLPELVLNGKNKELQTQCYSRALHSALMLGCTCTIHLGIQWPRTNVPQLMLKSQLGNLQGLFPTLPIIFSCASKLPSQCKGFHNSCVLELLAQHNKTLMCSRYSRSTQIKHSCAPELLPQHKHSNTHVLQCSLFITKHLINHVLQGPRPTHKIIHKTYVTTLCPIYQ